MSKKSRRCGRGNKEHQYTTANQLGGRRGHGRGGHPSKRLQPLHRAAQDRVEHGNHEDKPHDVDRSRIIKVLVRHDPFDLCEDNEQQNNRHNRDVDQPLPDQAHDIPRSSLQHESRGVVCDDRPNRLHGGRKDSHHGHEGKENAELFQGERSSQHHREGDIRYHGEIQRDEKQDAVSKQSISMGLAPPLAEGTLRLLYQSETHKTRECRARNEPRASVNCGLTRIVHTFSTAPAG